MEGFFGEGDIYGDYAPPCSIPLAPACPTFLFMESTVSLTVSVADFLVCGDVLRRRVVVRAVVRDSCWRRMNRDISLFISSEIGVGCGFFGCCEYREVIGCFEIFLFVLVYFCKGGSEGRGGKC